MLRSLLSSLIAAGLCAACTEVAPRPEGLPRNVVIVGLDTLRADHLGTYGYSRATSPFLDSLAADSFVFENAQSAAPWTAPSWISLMTSLYPRVHQVHTFPNPGRLPEEVTTLAEVLRANGYATGAFTEGGYSQGRFGLDQGFDVYPLNEGDAKDNTSNMKHPSRLVENLDRCIEWIEDRRDRPFLAFFQTYEPHTPFRAPEEFIRMFRPDYDEDAEHARLEDVIDGWNDGEPYQRDDLRLLHRHDLHCKLRGLPRIEDRERLAAEAQRLGVDLGNEELDEETIAWAKDLYDAEIRFTDHEIRRLWQALDDSRIREDTLFIVVSDHGEGLGDHGRIFHGSVLYEELIRVPLVARIPDPPHPPRRIRDVVQTIDVMPTLLDLLGLPTANLHMQGRSLVPLLEMDRSEEVPAFSQATRTHGGRNTRHSVRTRRYRMIVDTHTGEQELYDLLEDPGELRNVASERSEVARSLRELLTEQARVDASLALRLDARVEETEIDPALREQLELLGYVEEE